MTSRKVPDQTQTDPISLELAAVRAEKCRHAPAIGGAGEVAGKQEQGKRLYADDHPRAGAHEGGRKPLAQIGLRTVTAAQQPTIAANRHRAITAHGSSPPFSAGTLEIRRRRHKEGGMPAALKLPNTDWRGGCPCQAEVNVSGVRLATPLGSLL